MYTAFNITVHNHDGDEIMLHDHDVSLYLPQLCENIFL